MGFIDAFVYARHQHRRSIDNPVNSGDCMKGRVRFMTAITPSYAHAYQLICLTGNVPAALHSNFRLPAAKARYPHLPHVRTTTHERGNLHGWALYTDGSTALADCETLAGWGDVARTHHGKIYVMFGPVITTEAHLASQVPELTPTTPLKYRPWSRTSPFLDPMARLPVMRTRVFCVTANMLLVFAWARFKPAHMSSWHLLVSSRC